MKIVVIGPGAVGCLFSALLTKAAQSQRSGRDDIWLLDKTESRAALLKKNGIKISGPAYGAESRIAVNVTSNVGDIGTADLCLLCVKSYDVKDAVVRSKPVIGDETCVVTLQNGLGTIEAVSEVISPDLVIGGTTHLGVTLREPGIIAYMGKGETHIGRLDGKIPVAMRYVRDALNKAGLETKISRDIKAALWSKLVINGGINALAAITRLNNGRLITQEYSRAIIREAVTEAVKVAKRKRVKLLYDDPLAKVEAVCEATQANISSMLQDILRRKRTEIDSLNGVVVRLGQELGMPVPVNTLLVNIIKTIESNYEVSREL